MRRRPNAPSRNSRASSRTRTRRRCPKRRRRGARDVGQVTRQLGQLDASEAFRGVAGAKPAESRDVAEPGAAVRSDGAGRSGAQGVRSRGGDLRRGRRRGGDVRKNDGGGGDGGGETVPSADGTSSFVGRTSTSRRRGGRAARRGRRRCCSPGRCTSVTASRTGAQVLRALDGDSHREIREARETAVLTRCALKVQRVFRGNKAREEARRRATARSVARHYAREVRCEAGTARGRRAQRVDGGSYVQRWDASPLAKQASSHPFFKTEGRRRKPRVPRSSSPPGGHDECDFESAVFESTVFESTAFESTALESTGISASSVVVCFVARLYYVLIDEGRLSRDGPFAGLCRAWTSA